MSLETITEGKCVKKSKFLIASLWSADRVWKIPSYLVDAVQNNIVTIFSYCVCDPERYSVAECDVQGYCLRIEKNLEHPKNN